MSFFAVAGDFLKHFQFLDDYVFDFNEVEKLQKHFRQQRNNFAVSSDSAGRFNFEYFPIHEPLERIINRNHKLLQ